VNAEWQAIMIPTNCRSEGAPLAAERRGLPRAHRGSRALERQKVGHRAQHDAGDKQADRHDLFAHVGRHKRLNPVGCSPDFAWSNAIAGDQGVNPEAEIGRQYSLFFGNRLGVGEPPTLCFSILLDDQANAGNFACRCNHV
jgi:hypothetical protein